MAIDLGNSSAVDRLMTRIKVSFRAMAPFREKRRELIMAASGSEYPGQTGSRRKLTMVNWLAETAKTHMTTLASAEPRVYVTSEDPRLAPFAKKFTVATNALLSEIHFGETYRKIVLDAFFGLGVAKIYWGASEQIEIPNPALDQFRGVDSDTWDVVVRELGASVWIDPGKPYVEAVSLDDYVLDTQAAGFEKMRYAGHLYRVPMSAIEQDPRFDREVVQKIVPSTLMQHAGLFDRYDPASTLQEGGEQTSHDVEDMATLFDVYLPMERKWAVFCPGVWEPLYFDDWQGPEGGPFRHLQFESVPDNVLPPSPAQHLINLHELGNALERKSANQARRQKDVTIYRGDEDEANAIRRAEDGDFVRVANPDMVQALSYGGVNQLNAAFAQTVEAKFSRAAGNLDARAGLGPSAPTAKQDAMIQGQVSRAELWMQTQCAEFIASVAKDLGSMMWVDAAYRTQGAFQEPGIMFPIEVKWTPEDREGDIIQYNFGVVPYSNKYTSPTERLQNLNGALQVLAPLVQMAGGVINPVEVAELFASYGQLPELRTIISFPMMMGMPPGGPAGSAGPGGVDMQGLKPQKEYIHRSVSQTTPGSERVQMSQQMQAAANDNRNKQGA